MKPTVHQCLESMLFDGLKAVETAVAAYKTAQIDFFKNRSDMRLSLCGRLRTIWTRPSTECQTLK